MRQCARDALLTRDALRQRRGVGHRGGKEAAGLARGAARGGAALDDDGADTAQRKVVRDGAAHDAGAAYDHTGSGLHVWQEAEGGARPGGVQRMRTGRANSLERATLGARKNSPRRSLDAASAPSA